MCSSLQGRTCRCSETARPAHHCPSHAQLHRNEARPMPSSKRSRPAKPARLRAFLTSSTQRRVGQAISTHSKTWGTGSRDYRPPTGMLRKPSRPGTKAATVILVWNTLPPLHHTTIFFP
ncbi:hypothetical protein EJ04DRAFT_276233 [Polyplosphaeria fusca]|uniref:Uncharacterized protein n=1 Tax=Polyplosphaeria fusca TaxID=682080 RepID=A0A9P4QV33_9PLEO|nr:hypothetical protein EJ04DRAFT_276233 [Polyplosphaeria fusca]